MSKYVKLRVHLFVCSRFTISIGVLMMKIPNKCSLSTVVYTVFYRQTAQYILSEIEAK